MTKASLVFFLVCAIAIIGKSYGTGAYYLHSYPLNQDLTNFAPLSAIIQPDCDKSKEMKEEGSSESSSSSSESSSEESSSESKEGESSSSSEESKSSSEASGEKGSTEAASKVEEGSKEEKSSEESKEKSKEAPKKKKKSKESKAVLPPRTYTFPARQMQRIVYSSAIPYNYLPYRSTYVVQQPVSSYAAKSNYQYISLPSSAALLNPYGSQVVSRVSSPVTRIVYSAASVPAVTKTVVSPGSQAYIAPVAWNSPLFKK